MNSFDVILGELAARKRKSAPRREPSETLQLTALKRAQDGTLLD
jgi:hypothetical protein